MKKIEKYFEQTIEKELQKILNESTDKEIFIIKKRKQAVLGNFILFTSSFALFLIALFNNHVFGIILFLLLVIFTLFYLINGIKRKIVINRNTNEIYIDKLMFHKKYNFSDILEINETEYDTIILKMKDNKKIVISNIWDENVINIFDTLINK